MSDDTAVKIGTIINCSRLNVRATASIHSDVVCEVVSGCEVMIDESESTKEFYKVYTAAGLTGFCMKEYVEV